MAVLIDTSFLLATIFPNDVNHALAREAVKKLHQPHSIIPAPVLQELFYMTTVRVNYNAAVNYLAQTLNASFDIQPLVAQDSQRMVSIMRQYASAAFDYTDSAIMALSERLKITQVYTFDQRDFRIFRPQHAPFLELLP